MGGNINCNQPVLKSVLLDCCVRNVRVHQYEYPLSDASVRLVSAPISKWRRWFTGEIRNVILGEHLEDGQYSSAWMGRNSLIDLGVIQRSLSAGKANN